jgi:AcrR family transcriptional regulator
MVPWWYQVKWKNQAMGPRTKAREEETGGTEARKRILGAALTAFMEGGYAQTSTLEIATRARVSKRELYALFGNKEAMLVACITERAQRLKAPADLPELRDRKILTEVLDRFWNRLLTETTDPVVVAVFRLAISETVHAPKVAQRWTRSPASPRATHCARSWQLPNQPGFSLAIPTR